MKTVRWNSTVTCLLWNSGKFVGAHRIKRVNINAFQFSFKWFALFWWIVAGDNFNGYIYSRTNQGKCNERKQAAATTATTTGTEEKSFFPVVVAAVFLLLSVNYTVRNIVKRKLPNKNAHFEWKLQIHMLEACRIVFFFVKFFFSSLVRFPYVVALSLLAFFFWRF